MSADMNILELQEENAQLHALVQHQREELEQVAFFKEAFKDPRVKQGLYLYRKGLGLPFASFSSWCSKGVNKACTCWRCLADKGLMSSPDSELHAMVDSANTSNMQLTKVQIMAADGDQQAIDALGIIAQLDACNKKD